jgi:hypothetical protein
VFARILMTVWWHKRLCMRPAVVNKFPSGVPGKFVFDGQVGASNVVWVNSEWNRKLPKCNRIDNFRREAATTIMLIRWVAGPFRN